MEGDVCSSEVFPKRPAGASFLFFCLRQAEPTSLIHTKLLLWISPKKFSPTSRTIQAAMTSTVFHQHGNLNNNNNHNSKNVVYNI